MDSWSLFTQDFIPILPGEFLGYRHPSGEVHIRESGVWTACPGQSAIESRMISSEGVTERILSVDIGQDNDDKACTTGDVVNIFEGNLCMYTISVIFFVCVFPHLLSFFSRPYGTIWASRNGLLR
jgi:hypothetical protein